MAHGAARTNEPIREGTGRHDGAGDRYPARVYLYRAGYSGDRQLAEWMAISMV